VHAGKAVVDRSNRARMSVPLKALPAGSYKVMWHVLSVDTHRTQGDFSFRVGP
jgi:methionine-rich copper-binding protein CopC